ncbi:type II toxin-antitoxin system VapC family toxin [Granulicella sibirica]|uniref:PIN domain-containing protein n=1 Tax=Granulicella sibirica TaxID=2479048 RepID=A0A4Q0SUY7_9BACT|nr:type II toxin-antitoxin system VapC family toxin [Granulicella sibirica]RXH54557.1 hypothetical protein GRAN_3661 [Granulicella sibirica]
MVRRGVQEPQIYDTNILIDCLKGVQAARLEVDAALDRAMSTMTWIEVMVGVPPESDEVVRVFLGSFELLPITPEVAERAVLIRKTMRIKLPDAIILATAQVNERILVTRNTRDFGVVTEGVRVPYPL